MPDQNDVLELQELPENGGSAVHPELFGLTSWISVESDCTTLSITITSY